jgi:hypothetical protein
MPDDQTPSKPKSHTGFKLSLLAIGLILLYFVSLGPVHYFWKDTTPPAYNTFLNIYLKPSEFLMDNELLPDVYMEWILACAINGQSGKPFPSPFGISKTGPHVPGSGRR